MYTHSEKERCFDTALASSGIAPLEGRQLGPTGSGLLRVHYKYKYDREVNLRVTKPYQHH